MMDNIISISIFIVLLNLTLSFGQKLSCTYANNEEFEYSCYMTIQNPDGLNNFTDISEIYIYINQINAIDERMIDLTGVEIIDMNDNVCASGRIIDDSATRQSMRNALQRCFDNYKALFPETTTNPIATSFQTINGESNLPKGCFDSYSDEKGCSLQVENESI
ncbi:hypothetical protein ACKWTF_001553 [Chironomus riparius]